jgi:uncharacterized protein YbjQ (UPF0145 family)
MKTYALILFTALAWAGCASDGRNIVTGTPRPEIPVEQVVIYSLAPTNHYEVIATVMSEVGGSSQSSADKATLRLKQRAAKLGANGLIIGNININKSERTYYGMPIGPGPSHTGIGGTAIYVP